VGKRTALSTTTKRGRVEKVEIAGYRKVVKQRFFDSSKGCQAQVLLRQK
jgi:hypothetical protein